MRPLALALVSALLLAPSARAQVRRGPSPDARPVRVDVSKLPIDIQRIYRVLEAEQQAERVRTQNPFHLEYYVEVYGKAPDLDLFTNFDPKIGPVPFGAPTHQEFLNLVTPREFRAATYGGINAFQLIDWLRKQFSKKSEGSKP